MLGSSVNSARKGRLTAPWGFYAIVTVLALLETHEPVGMLCLSTVYILHFVLQAPEIVFRSKSVLRIHLVRKS